jgi:5-methylcytosine-specific restriction endonuclease McrA
MGLEAQAVAIHLPWWLWPLGIGLVAVRLFEERQRATRKAKHRAYLRSGEWKSRRREALALAGGRCQDCGTTERLHVHHLTYVRHGQEEMRDLRVLCSPCHRRRHRDGGRMDDLIDRLIGWLRS